MKAGPTIIRTKLKVHDAHDAIEALLAGRPIAVPHRPAFGCSTKWPSKSADVQREWARIIAEPVKLTRATGSEVKSLRAYATDKVTGIHFWNTRNRNLESTFNQLETTYRMYRGRSFGFVTVNTDLVADRDKVTDFLKAQHASNTNSSSMALSTNHCRCTPNSLPGSGKRFTTSSRNTFSQLTASRASGKRACQNSSRPSCC